MTIRGFVEAVAEHEVRGWVFDEDEPDRYVPVVAWLDGIPVGKALADILRPDLLAEGIGNGDHEFRIAFASPIRPADVPRLDIQAGEGAAGLSIEVLPGSNQSRADAASDPGLPIADPDQHPVFILGPARSGTSALALALLKSGRYEGHGEGHLMPLAKELLQTVDNYYRTRRDVTSNDTTLRAIHLATFQRMVRRGFIQLTRAAFPSGYWLDKTPTAEMVRAAPQMLEMWPNAKFIFLKRRVIENIMSRRRKFPMETLESYYLDWVDVLSAWFKVRGSLGNAWLELDQLEMARQNDVFSSKVSDFLHLKGESAENLRHALASDRPEQTSDKFGVSMSIEELELEPSVSRELRKACDPIMNACGYVYGPAYFS